MILLCPAASRADPDLIARELTAGFGALTGADAQKLPPYHLRIVAARRGDTIARIVRRMPPLSEGRESIFRALNRLAAGMEVRPGQSLKIIE
jgi:predicted Zn-dependent protease